MLKTACCEVRALNTKSRNWTERDEEFWLCLFWVMKCLFTTTEATRENSASKESAVL